MITFFARRRSIDKAPLELFFEWSHLEFRRPGAAILMGYMPVRLGNRLGLQQVFLL
jgi:hypothetical protein